MGKPLRLMSFVWGDTHIGWMEKSLIRSLRWPENESALKDAVWHIFTRRADEEKVKTIASKVRVGKIMCHHLPDELSGTPPQMGLILLQALLIVMDDCLSSGAQLLTAPPDTFFSEGSIPNMVQMARFNDTCVAVPHARVTPAIFGTIKDDVPLSGQDLVQRLSEYPHKSWTSSEIGIQDQSSFIGGIAWQKTRNLYMVQHRLPTIYLANFVKSDVDFFTTSHDGSEPVYGAWDHLWPMKLIKEERQRMPGSSDVACLLEVTKEDQNVPGKVEVNPYEPDAFWRNALHNKHNRQFLYVMRE